MNYLSATSLSLKDFYKAGSLILGDFNSASFQVSRIENVPLFTLCYGKYPIVFLLRRLQIYRLYYKGSQEYDWRWEGKVVYNTIQHGQGNQSCNIIAKWK